MKEDLIQVESRPLELYEISTNEKDNCSNYQRTTYRLKLQLSGQPN